ncbi:MAG: flagellar filament capping protein FliD [Lachnospiraceae bacterium]|nr:flagellar filament capping protein FliD [Lachnospiraceae bacterium]
MAMNTAIYNNLIPTFEPKYTTKFAHKSSELRSVVKRIRKETQESPVYLLHFTNKKQSYVLGVKEASMKLEETLNVLADDSENALFSKRKAHSSDPEQVSAELLDSENEQLPSAFSIKVKQLANAQVNEGKVFYETGKGLDAGSYQFKVTVNDVGYDFQYNIRKDANHREVIDGLANFITKAKIGLVAEPYSPEENRIGMRIESLSLGTSNGYDSFTFEDKIAEGRGKGIVSYYGLDRIAVKPKNAIFDLNGAEKSSTENEFTLGNAVKVTLLRPSDTEAEVDYRPDSDLILEGVRDFVSNYNELVGHSVAYTRDTDIPSKLLREMSGLMAPYKNELESYGMTFDDDGFIELDEALAADAVVKGEMQEMFRADSPMVLRLRAKSESVKINPMEYIDKRIVSYPNTSKPPRGYSYISSLYSGLLFNSYC